MNFIKTIFKDQKIRRNKFLFSAGSVIFGFGLIAKNPIKFLQSKLQEKPSIKITANPHAVRRNSRKANIG